MQTAASNSEDITFNVTAFKGVDMGLGQDDPAATKAEHLAAQYPNHMILVQSGTFLHGYNKTAHILNTMKGYKLQLVGKDKVHIRVGFPVANFKRRMHEISREFDTPYVAAVGCKKMGYTVFVSDKEAGDKSLLRSVPEGIVDQVISDLQQRGELNKVGAKQLLANPDTSGFKLKQFAQDLDNQITMDLIKMPRDVRATFGESLRVVMQRVMQGVFA